MKKMTQFAAVLWLLGFSLLFACSTAQDGFQSGNVNISGVLEDSCKVYCKAVVFPRRFSSSHSVQVLASVSHAGPFLKVHDPSVLWTESITIRGFRVCVKELGSGTNRSAVVNWLAFQVAPSGYLSGTASFPLFTSGTKCKRVNFAQNFKEVPRVIATSHHKSIHRPQNAMNLWLEDVSRDYFRICLKEVKTFDGKHNDIDVNWLAFVKNGLNITFSERVIFRNLAAPLEKDNFAYCKVINFTSTFYAPPVVLVTANHVYDRTNVYSIKPENNAINTWIEEKTKKNFRLCVKDNAGLASQHDPINVDYIVLGDLDPCLKVRCSNYALCKAFGPRDARCVCVLQCPSYDEPVCSSNGTTYENKCIFEREMCLVKANQTIYHPGSCSGFPMEKGRQSLYHLPSWSEVVCTTIFFSPQIFYPDKPVHVQATVNHVNSSDPNHVHEAAVSWVEKVTDTQFAVCVTKAGRNKDPSPGGFATIDWMGYQGAPEKGIAGEMDMPRWWTGTICRTVRFPGKFSAKPYVLLTAEHERRGLKHDAAFVWAQDVTANSFDICVRELQNFDGVHDDIHMNWLAFEELHHPVFKEHGLVKFPNTSAIPLQQNFNFAFCKDVRFTVPYNDTPLVLVTANHSTSSDKLASECNGISSWVEYINKTGFRSCVKEILVKKHDPISVSYVVLGDVCPFQWSYYNGSCYYTSSNCDSWSKADNKCRDLGSTLASIESQEENVFVQRLHNGANAWIGLNDIASEGVFKWVDGCKERYRFWAKNQPNNLNNQDCVHTLGVTKGYTWNDVSCFNCNNFTCKKDYNDCLSNPCLNGGRCVNEARNYSCVCPSSHFGRRCEEYNACYKNPCQHGGTCHVGNGNYTCTCPSQYKGRQCQEIDECHSSPCLNGGTCIDGSNSFTCSCPRPYGGSRCEVLHASSCKDIKTALHSSGSGGNYWLSGASKSLRVYCDMTDNGGGWTLIARFSNSDGKNWMRDDGYWWYDQRYSQGQTTNPSNNYDMISPAFWLVRGREFKITRSDDRSHTALLRTTSNCLAGRTFRSMISRFGRFTGCTSWASNRCRGSCSVAYGGLYRYTSGFNQARCSSNIQSYNYIGFWCDWSGGDGAVMMIGGGGSGCQRADHGIGITEDNDSTFQECNGSGELDFGNEAHSVPTTSYSLNLWVR